MANERFKLGGELTGAFRSGTPAKADRSLPIQQISLCALCDRELVFNLGVIVRITAAMLGFDAQMPGQRRASSSHEIKAVMLPRFALILLCQARSLKPL